MSLLFLVTVLVVAPSTFGYPATVSNNEGEPGSAGHHGSVQSGQFLITNNDNYGLEFTPYISPQQEQQQQKQQWEMSSPQQRSSQDEGQLCAGCLPLTNNPSQFRSQLPQFQQSNANSNNGGFGYSVNLQQQSQQPQQWATPVINQKQWNSPQPSNQQWAAPPTSQQQKQQQLQQWAVPQAPQERGQQGQTQWGNSGFGYSVSRQPQLPRQSFNQQWTNQGPANTQQWEPQQQFNQDPATVQHLQINDNGQYSFSYNAADSSRQEQRNLDGSVSGNYAYTDPQGKQVQVDYRASPNEGYRAFGPHIPPQSSVQQQLPVPVQDTPEVQAAREQFFQAYKEQVDRIEKETAARANLLKAQKKDESSKVVSVYSENGGQPAGEEDGSKGTDDSHPVKSLDSASDFKNLPEPIAVPDSNGLGHSEIDEDDEAENDAIVISSDDSSAAPSSISQKNEEQGTSSGQQGKVQQDGGPNNSYQLSFVVGANVGNQAGQQAVPVTQRGGEVQGQWPQQVQTQWQQQQVQPQWQQPQMGQRQWQQSQQGQQNQWQQAQSTQGDNLKSGLPGYFYYVSVGGSPHFVTSNNLMKSDFPTSLKAHLAGAIPAAAVHDAQTPYNTQFASGQSSAQQQENKVTPPVYLDMQTKPETSNNNWNVQQPQQQQQNPFVFGFIPGTIVSFRSDGGTANTATNNKVEGSTNGQQIPVLGYPLLVFKNK